MSAMLEIIDRMESSLGENKIEMQALFDDLRKNPPCPKAWNHLFVDWTGNVMICCFHTRSVGNLHNQSMEDIWNGSEMQEIRKRFLEHDYSACNARCTFIADRREQGHKIAKAPL